MGPKVPKSLADELLKVKDEHQALLIQLDKDKNESEAALSEVFRSRVDYRNKEEESLSEIQKLKAEISGFSPKLEGAEKEITNKADELDNLQDDYSRAREPIEVLNEQMKPLQDKLRLIEDEKSQLEEELALAKREAEEVESNFNLLSNRRNQISENFELEHNRLLEGIKKPAHIYYSESKEIQVANRAPSGKGIFINKGYNAGFRDQMEFISRNLSTSSDRSFRLKAKLVQKNFSFLEFQGEEQLNDPSFAREGETLQITRSGKSDLIEDLDQNKSSQK